MVAQGPRGTPAADFLHVVREHDPVDSAQRVMAFAKDLLAAARSVRMPHNNQPALVRVGLHTGPCTSGLIGSRLPKFSIFGDSMNTASRMEVRARGVGGMHAVVGPYSANRLLFIWSYPRTAKQFEYRTRVLLNTSSCLPACLPGPPLYRMCSPSHMLPTTTTRCPQSTGVPGRIQVSEATHTLLPGERWEPSGGIEVKGKGTMQTFLWVEPPGEITSPSADQAQPTAPLGPFTASHRPLRQLVPPAPVVATLLRTRSRDTSMSSLNLLSEPLEYVGGGSKGSRTLLSSGQGHSYSTRSMLGNFHVLLATSPPDGVSAVSTNRCVMGDWPAAAPCHAPCALS